MKYAPGNYSVTFFNNVGTKLYAVYKDHDDSALTSLHQATALAEAVLKKAYGERLESYVIHRVIVNSAVKKAAV